MGLANTSTATKSIIIKAIGLRTLNTDKVYTKEELNKYIKEIGKIIFVMAKEFLQSKIKHIIMVFSIETSSSKV